MDKLPIQDNAGVVIFPPLLYFITLIVSITISYLFPYNIFPAHFAIPIGAILSIAGFTLLLLGARTFVKNKNPVNPAASTQLIITIGIYQYTRNPMYLGLTIMYLGISMLLNAWSSLVLILPLLRIVQKGIIEREEKYLTRKFGNEYLNYKSKVRRWL
jgi:protein-S-isoprenylcysteine O-methyltransferase Ste14